MSKTPALESEMNEITHAVADWLEKYVDQVDRNTLNQKLDELFSSNYGLQIEEDPTSEPGGDCGLVTLDGLVSLDPGCACGLADRDAPGHREESAPSA